MSPKRDDSRVPHKRKKEKPRCGNCGGKLGWFGGCSICAQRERRRKREEKRQRQEDAKEQHARKRAKEGLG